MLPLRPLLAALVAVVTAATLAGCAASAKAAARAQGQLLVVTSVYPLQFVAERVGGNLVHVVDLARPGAEPHELELKPRDVAAVEDADLVVYLSRFQPAVDKAVASSAGGRALDVAPAAGLDPAAEPDAADLAKVAEFVRRQKVLTVDTETLASPDVARALAAETGVRTAVLDPVETRPEGGDYVTALRADLATLRQG